MGDAHLQQLRGGVGEGSPPCLPVPGPPTAALGQLCSQGELPGVCERVRDLFLPEESLSQHK